jgi:hypothetical protein
MAEDAYNEPLPMGMYIPLVVLQMLSSFLSVVGACFVIRISTPKLGSTYQRFLFLLSTAIAMNAIFLFLHPILVPRGDTPWGVGNEMTCSMVAFFWVFGALLVSFYHNSLAMYFYFSIQGDNDSIATSTTTNGDSDNKEKRRQRQRQREPEDIVGYTEILVNVVCWIVPGAVASAGAALHVYSFDSKVDMCVLYRDCDLGGSENCVTLDYYGSVNTYGTSTSEILRNTFHWILVASACISVLVMAMIQCKVRRASKTSRIAARQYANEEIDLDSAEERQQITQKLAAVSNQCVLYTLSYLNSYVWFIALIFIPANNVNLLYAFQLIASIFYSGLGVFNCFIYIRPRVQMLQIMYPQDPFVVVLRVAMSKAGDLDQIEMVREIIYGSEYSGSEAQEQDSDGVGSRDSAIPSVVHFDSDQKPLSSKSLVSTPGEGDEDMNNSSLLSPLGDLDGDGSSG